MRYIALLLFVLLFPLIGIADEGGEGEEPVQELSPVQMDVMTGLFRIDSPPFLFYRDRGELKVLTESSVENFDFDGMPKFFGWEGWSSFTLFQMHRELELYWKIDLPQSGYLSIRFIQHQDGSIVVIEKTTNNANKPTPEDEFLCKSYTSYDELLKADYKDQIAKDTRKLMKRVGQQAVAPTKEILQFLLFNKAPEVDPQTKRECLTLMENWIDDDWRVRDHASYELSNVKYFIMLRQLRETEKLTPEQYLRCDLIFQMYDDVIQNISPKLKEKLKTF